MANLYHVGFNSKYYSDLFQMRPTDCRLLLHTTAHGQKIANSIKHLEIEFYHKCANSSTLIQCTLIIKKNILCIFGVVLTIWCR